MKRACVCPEFARFRRNYVLINVADADDLQESIPAYFFRWFLDKHSTM
jgi:hypothetical protein